MSWYVPSAWEERWERRGHFHGRGFPETHAPENLTRSGVYDQLELLMRPHQDQRDQWLTPVLRDQKNASCAQGQGKVEAHRSHEGLTGHGRDVQAMARFQVVDFQTEVFPGGPCALHLCLPHC